jgi:protein-disulfide isomerase
MVLGASPTFFINDLRYDGTIQLGELAAALEQATD